MADRNAAEIFGFVFRTLAERADHECAALNSVARAVWRKSFDYDFTHEQMEADEALGALGLAKPHVVFAGPTEIQYAEPDGSFKPLLDPEVGGDFKCP